MSRPPPGTGSLAPPVDSRIDDRRPSLSSRVLLLPGTFDDTPDRLSLYSRDSLGSRSRSGVRSLLVRPEGRLLRSDRWCSRRLRSCSPRAEPYSSPFVAGPRLLVSRLSLTTWMGSGPRGVRSAFISRREESRSDSGGRSWTGVVTGEAPANIWASEPAKFGLDRDIRRLGPRAFSTEALSSIF